MYVRRGNNMWLIWTRLQRRESLWAVACQQHHLACQYPLSGINTNSTYYVVRSMEFAVLWGTSGPNGSLTRALRLPSGDVSEDLQMVKEPFWSPYHELSPYRRRTMADAHDPGIDSVSDRQGRLLDVQMLVESVSIPALLRTMQTEQVEQPANVQ